MAKRQMTINERSYFLAIVANQMLNNDGKSFFFSGHYWRVHFAGFLTHEVLDGTEAELARLIGNKEYRK